MGKTGCKNVRFQWLRLPKKKMIFMCKIHFCHFLIPFQFFELLSSQSLLALVYRLLLYMKIIVFFLTNSLQFFFCVQQVEVTDSSMQLKKLETGKLYKVFVVSKNAHGTSIPSSILLLNITETGKMNTRTNGFHTYFTLAKFTTCSRSGQQRYRGRYVSATFIVRFRSQCQLRYCHLAAARVQPRVGRNNLQVRTFADSIVDVFWGLIIRAAVFYDFCTLSGRSNT